jgi:hypothetical protein
LLLFQQAKFSNLSYKEKIFMTTFSNLWKHVINFLTSAMYWIGFGLEVIPVIAGTKRTAVKWDQWLNGLDPEKVYEYWTEHPDHEVGCIVGDDLIVFDADSTEALIALVNIEARFGVMPKMAVNTTRGQHHYFRRAPGTVARSDSHDSEKFPDQVDIKTGRSLVVLPISTGKTLHMLNAENTNGLSVVNQEFIDAINRHNGRTAPTVNLSLSQKKADGTSLYKVEALLNNIDPDSGYEDWLRVGMAIYHETGGSGEGMALYDRWSSKGEKYKGIKDIETKWRSFHSVESPVTIGTLVKMAKDAGADIADIIGDNFEPCEYEVVDPAKVYYINVDDTTRGLLEKLQIAEEYEFHMLAEGFKDFIASEFYSLITRMTESGDTQGVIIVLDTLKKFTDLMSKKLCSQFGRIIRRFVMKGGTVISLAHTNKNPDQENPRDLLLDRHIAKLQLIDRGSSTTNLCQAVTNPQKQGAMDRCFLLDTVRHISRNMKF